MRINQRLLIICLFWISASHAQQPVIDSLENILTLNKRDVEMAKAYITISSQYRKRDTEKAIKYAWQAKTLSKELNNNKTLSTSYTLLINIYKNTSKLDSVEFYLEALKNLAANASKAESDYINLDYNSTIGLYYKNSGKGKEALPYLLKAYEQATKMGNVTEASGQALNLGGCYYQFSDFQKSLEYYFLALKGFESVGNKSGISFSYNNISNCLYEMNRLAEAMTYLNKSIKIKKELGDKSGMANAEQNLGNIYMGMGEFNKATLHFNNAIALNSGLKNNVGLAGNYFNLGRLNSQRDPTTAVSYFEKSKKLSIKNRDSTLLKKIELEVLAIKKRDAIAIESETEAINKIQTFKEAGQKSDEAFGYKNLADYYTLNKEYDKALEYTKKFHEIRDSIKNNEILAQFKTIEEQYNKEKNEKQIVLLQKDQQINEQKLNRQRFLMIIFILVILLSAVGIYMLVSKNRLKQRMQELELRNRIAADLHDEVGSSLSSIYMLSQMAGKTQFDSTGELLEKVKTNAKETMERMGDIVWMIKPTENEGEGLKYRMERFVHEICNAQNITCTFLADDLNEVKLNMMQKKNVYLIFKEAVNNAVKYSETKKLEIKIKQHDMQLEMEIKDFGKGFHEKTVLKGNGLDNMKNRATELNGNLKFDSTPEMGTTVQLSFPI